MEDFIKQAKGAGYDEDTINKYLAAKGFSSNNQTDSGITDWKGFVQKAAQVAKEENYPLGVLLGQAALESGRGTSGLTTQDNNYFGIKGSGNAGSSNWPTQEADDAGNYYTTNSDFAKYASPEDSIRAYIKLIKSQYPEAYAKRSNPNDILQAIKDHGYATSPTYVQNVAATPEFQAFQGGNP